MFFRLCQSCLITLCVLTIHAQSNGLVLGGKWSSQIYISDVNGRPFQNKYDDISGTPYFNEQYKFANIKLAKGQGRIFVHVKTRIDIAAQETYFISTNGVEAVIEAGTVKEIFFADATADAIFQYKFQTGFPPIDMKTGNHFYQIICEGNCSLLKSVTKKITERKSELSGEVLKEFEIYENYYLFSKGEIKRLKRDKDFILAELSDKAEQVNRFIQSNKINLKNNEQLVKLINYYNSL